MSTTEFQTKGVVRPWGNGLAVRFAKAVVATSGMTVDSPVKIIAQPGRIIIEAQNTGLSLDQMLDKFDPLRHGGEVMAYKPVGVEVL